MKFEYINPFIESSQSIINMTTGLSPAVGEVHIKQAPYKGNNTVIFIGLTGQIHGSVTFSLKNELACKLASSMMGGMPVPELDEMGKSAISELCNMILGNTASVFYKNDIAIDITPPTIFTGNNIELTPTHAEVVCVPLHFDNGDSIEIDINYKEKI